MTFLRRVLSWLLWPIRYLRVKRVAVALQLAGHTNAARLAHDWRPPLDKVSAAELEKAKQNFLRRFGTWP